MLPLPLRVDGVSLPALIAGALVLCCSAALALKQWWAYRRLIRDPKVSETGYQNSERQIRNRLIVAAILFAIGVAIPTGDQLDFFLRSHPGIFFVYWMSVLFLVFMMCVMALADVLLTLSYVKATQGEMRQQREELQEEIRRYRASRNGSDDRQSPL